MSKAQRLAGAIAATGFPQAGIPLLEQALDLTSNLPLALLGDKILDILLTLAFKHDGQSNHQITQAITRIANNNALIEIGRGIGLHDLVLVRGNPAIGHVRTAALTRNSKKAKKIPIPNPDTPDFYYHPKAVADTLEAIFGAAFLYGGLPAAAKVATTLRIDRAQNGQANWSVKWNAFAAQASQRVLPA